MSVQGSQMRLAMNRSYAEIKIRLIIAANDHYYNLLQEFEIFPVDDEVGITP
jgi:hypothetical protein